MLMLRQGRKATTTAILITANKVGSTTSRSKAKGALIHRKRCVRRQRRVANCWPCAATIRKCFPRKAAIRQPKPHGFPHFCVRNEGGRQRPHVSNTHCGTENQCNHRDRPVFKQKEEKFLELERRGWKRLIATRLHHRVVRSQCRCVIVTVWQ